MSQKLVVANWKMNGSLAANEALIDGILELPSVAQQIICPSSVYLPQLAGLLKGTSIELGAQNMDWRSAGAFTGEISATMLSDLSVGYVIVGHSERRSLFSESDELCAQKVSAAQDAGVVPILCVGETKEQRDSGAALAVVANQVRASLRNCLIESLVMAYEPVWAIGTGDSASPEQASEMHQLIRQVLAEINADQAVTVKILYGGSVNAGNAASLFEMKDIDGALVGGASLKAKEFSAICCA